jgi:hypothetical protein
MVPRSPVENGGTLVKGKFSIGPYGLIAFVEDTEGNSSACICAAEALTETPNTRRPAPLFTARFTSRLRGGN